MQETLASILNQWVNETVWKSNMSLPEGDKIRLKDRNVIEFNLEEINSLNTAINITPPIGKIILFKTPLVGKQLGEPYKENKVIVEKSPWSYANPSMENMVFQQKLSINHQEISEWEKTKSRTQGLSIALGATAYGAQAQIGYQANWNITTREKHEVNIGTGREIMIPIVIPPGGANYTFNRYRSELFQDYQLDKLLLRGTVVIHFDSHNVKYQEGKFVKGHGFMRHNKVEISIADIFADLKQHNTELQQIFREVKGWIFDRDNDLVTYQGKVKLFKFYMMEIETNAELNLLKQPLPSSTPSKIIPMPAPTEAKGQNQSENKKVEYEKSYSDAALIKQYGIEVINRNVGVVLPKSSAEGTFAETIKNKLMQGISENPDLKLLLEKLNQAAYANHIDFLEKQIEKMIEGIPNPDLKEYLAWYKKRLDKDPNFTMKACFDKRKIDVYIEEKEKQHNAEIAEYEGITEIKETTQHNLTNTQRANQS